MKLVKHITFLYWIMVCNSFLLANTTTNTNTRVAQIQEIQNDSTRLLFIQKLNTENEALSTDSLIKIWMEISQFCEPSLPNSSGLCYYYLARDLRRKGEYFKSYEAYEKSKNYYELANNLSGLAKIYNGLGSLYKDLDKTEKSLAHYLESIELYKSISDTIWEGNVYLNLGGMLEEADSLDKAIWYLKKSEKILRSKNHPNLLNCFINLGIVFTKQNEIDSAYFYFNESYQLAKLETDLRDKFNGTYYFGKFLFEQNYAELSSPIIKEAITIAENINNTALLSVTSWAGFYKLLGNYYYKLNDFEKSAFYLKRSEEYASQVNRTQATQKITTLDFEQLELQAQLKQNRTYLALIVAALILLFSLFYILLLYRNYKNKQRANRLLTEMDALKTRLYSNITHELRTPLTLILGPLEQMLTTEAKKKPSRQQIKLLRKNANSILQLVNQMLDLSKIDAKSLRLELVESDIVKFLKVRFASFSSLAEQKNIQFNCYLPALKKISFFDASKLEKVTNNLLSNAIKFTPSGGQVFCFASFPKSNFLELTIQDTGNGIPNKELSQIFNRFHQVSQNVVNGNIGTGIGLSLTKELVELMHGTIQVESIVGEGTKFKVQLPLGKDHLSSTEYIILEKRNSTNPTQINVDSTEEANHSSANGEPTPNSETLPTVLIVDDHMEICNFIRENLEPCYQIQMAENGLVGYKKAIEWIPDIIVTDVMMPKMDGIEMSKKIKLDERTSHIPIIILTAKAEIDDKLESLETGAEAFLAKPFNMKELKLRIKKMIELRKQLRERFTNNININPKDVVVSSVDEKFIDRLLSIIEENIGNSEFEVRQLQDHLLMSRMQLFRKIKALTNQTPGEFIRTMRLKRAASLMEQNFGNIAQITYEVGFNNPSYFAKCFKDFFGKLPSEFMKQNT